MLVVSNNKKARCCVAIVKYLQTKNSTTVIGPASWWGSVIDTTFIIMQ